jgi:hypothetical protein
MQKKFKKDLQIVMDSFWRHKNAAEFYNFMNAKYDLNHTNVESNIPLLSTKFITYPFERENQQKQ